MYRLLEITFANDKESQAIYSYDSKDALEGNYESKLGQAMLNSADELLIGLNNVGVVLFRGKVGEHVFLPRLYEAKTAPNKDTGVIEEVVDLAKYDDENTAHARFHTKKGAAINSGTCRQEVLYGFDGNGNQLDYCHWMPEPTIPQE